MSRREAVAGIVLLAGIVQAAQADFLAVAETDDDRVMLFDAFDGSVIDENFLLMDDLVEAWTGSIFDSARTPNNVIQVGNELWVADTGEDSIFRVNSNLEVFGRIGGSTSDFGGTGGLNDIRGMDQAGNRVYIVNDGSSNGAPGDDTMVVINATTGAIESNFQLRGEAEDVLVVGNELFVTNVDGNNSPGIGADDTIDVYDLDGNYLRTVVEAGGFNELNSPQQITMSSNGLLVASEFFPVGIFEFGLDGTALNDWLGLDIGITNNIFGVHELGNGNILFTVNNNGVYVLDVGTGTASLVSEGDPLYIERISIPEPGTLALLGAVGLFGLRRRSMIG